jgi:hypothetical protein
MSGERGRDANLPFEPSMRHADAATTIAIIESAPSRERLFAEARLFVLPRTRKNFGNIAFEAMLRWVPL